VRVLVVVLIGLVVVLAVLTELCLLQAAVMRRKIKAALPPTRRSTAEGSGAPVRRGGPGPGASRVEVELAPSTRASLLVARPFRPVGVRWGGCRRPG
jgi:hypothetical protein